MKTPFLTLILVGLMAATPALAHQCPALMAEIDAALETTEVAGTDLERVQALRQEGEDLHNAGAHADSEAALNEALEILGLI